MTGGAAWDIGSVTDTVSRDLVSSDVEALVGEWLELPEVAQQLNLPVSRVKQLVKERKLTGRKAPKQGYRIPAAFLSGDQILKGLPGTLTVLADSGLDELESLHWLFTPDDNLPGGTPIQAIHEHHGTEVNRRAQALAV